jgi:hypothetical protein
MDEQILRIVIPAIGLASGLIGAYVGLENRALLAEERVNCMLDEMKKRTAAGGSGRRRRDTRSLLRCNVVGSCAALVLERLDREPHPLAQAARDEAAYAVRLPARG